MKKDTYELTVFTNNFDDILDYGEYWVDSDGYKNYVIGINKEENKIVYTILKEKKYVHRIERNLSEDDKQ